MRYFWSILYNIFVVPLGVFFYHLFSVFSKKMQMGIRGRKKTFAEIKNLRKLYPDREIILLHSASLGEYEQVKPVVKGIKERDKEIITVVSFTSPSGYEHADKIPEVDLYIYLPFDFKSKVYWFLEILKPTKIIFVTYELWPNLLHVARKKHIKTYLISARIRKSSRKWRFYIKSYFAHLYCSLDHIFTVSNMDKEELLKRTGNKKLNIQTLGDTRYDQVIQRAELRASKNIPKIFNDGFVIIAGSVWEQDLEVITTPLVQLIKSNENVKLIIAPHETDKLHVNPIVDAFLRQGFQVSKYSELDGKCNDRVLVVNTIGVLAELYHQSNMAFVGGSFKGAIHNVMEPAVAGIPVIFGPLYHNSREAEKLVEFGGGFSCENSLEFHVLVEKLISDSNYYQKAAKASKDVIFNNKGAAEKTVNQILAIE